MTAEEHLEAQREHNRKLRARLDAMPIAPPVKNSNVAFQEAVAKYGTHPGRVWDLQDDGTITPADPEEKT